jgi:cytochrome c oxidase assembly protein subunit 15
MQRLAVITSIGIIITYATGTLVTDSGSGHGCGASWPLCRGQFIPQFAISTAIEFTHRVVVGLVSVLIIALAIGILWLWRSRRELLVLAIVMIPALLAEAGLGAALVLEPQSPLLLAVHFASSLILVTSIVLATLIILELGSWDRLRDRPVPGGFRILTFVLLLYTYVVGYLGAYIRLRGDELGCRSWPICNGKVIPGFTGPAGIVFSHWFAALFLLAGTLALLLWARRIRAMRPDLYRGSMFAFLAVIAQALAGAVVVFTKVAEASQMLHAGIVSLIFVSLCYTALQTLPRPAELRSIVARPRATPSGTGVTPETSAISPH